MTTEQGTVHGATILRWRTRPDALAADLRLRHVEWGLYLAVTGEHTVAELGAAFGLDDASRDRAVEALLVAGLVDERPVTYDEYLRANARSGDDQKVSLPQFLRAGVALPQATAASPGPAEAPPPPERDEATRIVETAATPRPPTPVAFRPLATTPPDTPSPGEPTNGGRQLNLKTLMRFILDRAADTNAGQLDVYRVFIRVNTKLLRRNGINTLRFADDRLVSDPELQRAITSSLEKTLGMACPESAWVS